MLQFNFTCVCICNKNPLYGSPSVWTICIIYVYICVYSTGDGKTHYIKKQLIGYQPYLVIAVNESFTPLNAILKLRSLPRDASCNVFFNFTILPSLVCKHITLKQWHLVCDRSLQWQKNRWNTRNSWTHWLGSFLNY